MLTEQSGGRHDDDDGGQEHQDREPDGHHGFPRWFLFRCRSLRLLELPRDCRSRCDNTRFVREFAREGEKVSKEETPWKRIHARHEEEILPSKEEA